MTPKLVPVIFKSKWETVGVIVEAKIRRLDIKLLVTEGGVLGVN